MRILILNTRDIAHPASGGAEIFTHEVAKRWVECGHEVIQFSSHFKGALSKQETDGITIVRKGGYATVFREARKFYTKEMRGRVDVVIDEYTLRPFLSTRYVREPIVFFANELAREKFFHELPYPIAALGYHLFEPRWIKSYLSTTSVTISRSTKDDLIECGISDVRIVPIGIGFRPMAVLPPKEEKPTILFVGLLKKSNLVSHVIDAFSYLMNQMPEAQLWVVGRGPEMKNLRDKAEGMNVVFHGYVSDEKKLELMRRAHILVVPAVREGWGLVVTEANGCGTPAVGYDVPGLRDSIRHMSTGVTTAPNPISLSCWVFRLLSDPALLKILSQNALSWSREFSWSRTSSIFMDVLEEITNE